MRTIMFKKILCSIVAFTFFINDLSFALSTQPGSNVFATRVKALEEAQERLEAKIGPRPIDWKKLTQGSFQDAPIPEGTRIYRAGMNVPAEWSKNPILKTKSLVDAFEYFLRVEAKLRDKEAFGVEAGYFEPDRSGSGDMPIYRWEYREERGKTGRWVLVLNIDYVNRWDEMRANDILIEKEISDPSNVLMKPVKRTASLAFANFYQVARRAMTDLDRSYRAKSKGQVSFVSPHTEWESAFMVDRNESDPERVRGRYALINETAWLAFLASYGCDSSVFLDNDSMRDRMLWFLGSYKGRQGDEAKTDELNRLAAKLRLPAEFPNIKDDASRREAVDLALAAYTQYRRYFKAREETGDQKLIRAALRKEYEARKAAGIVKEVLPSLGVSAEGVTLRASRILAKTEKPKPQEQSVSVPSGPGDEGAEQYVYKDVMREIAEGRAIAQTTGIVNGYKAVRTIGETLIGDALLLPEAIYVVDPSGVCVGIIDCGPNDHIMCSPLGGYIVVLSRSYDQRINAQEFHPVGVRIFRTADPAKPVIDEQFTDKGVSVPMAEFAVFGPNEESVTLKSVRGRESLVKYELPSGKMVIAAVPPDTKPEEQSAGIAQVSDADQLMAVIVFSPLIAGKMESSGGFTAKDLAEAWSAMRKEGARPELVAEDLPAQAGEAREKVLGIIESSAFRRFVFIKSMAAGALQFTLSDRGKARAEWFGRQHGPVAIFGDRHSQYYIGMSMGGTKLYIALYGRDEKDRPVTIDSMNISWDRVFKLKDGGDMADPSKVPPDDIVETMGYSIERMLEVNGLIPQQLNNIGCTSPGPIDQKAGIIGAGMKTVNLPFENYPFVKRLAQRLGMSYIEVSHDAAAGVNGEKALGMFRDIRNGYYVIQGTGLGGSALVGGEYYDAAGEITEPGHHIVGRPSAAEAYRYEYRWIPKYGNTHPYEVTNTPDPKKAFQIRPERARELIAAGEYTKDEMIWLDDGERDFEDVVAKQGIVPMLEDKGRLAGQFGGTEEDYDRLNGPKDIDVLALEGSDREKEIARKLIEYIGSEMGKGLAAFIASSYGKPWQPERIIIGSGIGERLGLGLTTDTGEDLYFHYIREAARTALSGSGVAASYISEIVPNIVRSQLTQEIRESAGFDRYEGSKIGLTVDGRSGLFSEKPDHPEALPRDSRLTDKGQALSKPAEQSGMLSTTVFKRHGRGDWVKRHQVWVRELSTAGMKAHSALDTRQEFELKGRFAERLDQIRSEDVLRAVVDRLRRDRANESIVNMVIERLEAMKGTGVAKKPAEEIKPQEQSAGENVPTEVLVRKFIDAIKGIGELWTDTRGEWLASYQDFLRASREALSDTVEAKDQKGKLKAGDMFRVSDGEPGWVTVGICIGSGPNDAIRYTGIRYKDAPPSGSIDASFAIFAEEARASFDSKGPKRVELRNPARLAEVLTRLEGSPLELAIRRTRSEKGFNVPEALVRAFDINKVRELGHVVGVPKEIKAQAERVGLTPKGVEFLTIHGIPVLVEKGAGREHFSDAEYAAAGAEMVNTAAEVWRHATIIKKVKEPLGRELELMQPGQTVFTYFHFTSKELAGLTRAVLDKKVTAVAYETVTRKEGGRLVMPLLRPMSIIAGDLGADLGIIYSLEGQRDGGSVKLTPEGGRLVKELKEGYPASPDYGGRFKDKEAVVLGGGVSGERMARGLLKALARVTITDINADRREELKKMFAEYGDRVTVLDPGKDINEPTAELLAKYMSAEVLGGCILAGAGRKAPQMGEELLGKISEKKSKVIVDIALDQGGNFSGAHSLSHADPCFVDKFGNTRYCVPNMPDAVGKVASVELEKTNIAHTFALAMGWKDTVALLPELASGFNAIDGVLTHEGVSEAYPELSYVPFATVVKKTRITGIIGIAADEKVLKALAAILKADDVEGLRASGVAPGMLDYLKRIFDVDDAGLLEAVRENRALIMRRMAAASKPAEQSAGEKRDELDKLMKDSSSGNGTQNEVYARLVDGYMSLGDSVSARRAMAKRVRELLSAGVFSSSSGLSSQTEAEDDEVGRRLKDEALRGFLFACLEVAIKYGSEELVSDARTIAFTHDPDMQNPFNDRLKQHRRAVITREAEAMLEQIKAITGLPLCTNASKLAYLADKGGLFEDWDDVFNYFKTIEFTDDVYQVRDVRAPDGKRVFAAYTNKDGVAETYFGWDDIVSRRVDLAEALPGTRVIRAAEDNLKDKGALNKAELRTVGALSGSMVTESARLDTKDRSASLAYIMQRGVFGSRPAVKFAFQDPLLRQRFDITIIRPGVFGKDNELMHTAGHFHDPKWKPELYQVIYGKAAFMLQRTHEDLKGDKVTNPLGISRAIMVEAEAGDNVVILPGYGHVTTNLSPDRPLVLANWLTWDQSSQYGSYDKKQGGVGGSSWYAAYENGKVVYRPHPAFRAADGTYYKIPDLEVKSPAREVRGLGLKGGEPIYGIAADSRRFTRLASYLNDPFAMESADVTPETVFVPKAVVSAVAISKPHEQSAGVSETRSGPDVSTATAARMLRRIRAYYGMVRDGGVLGIAAMAALRSIARNYSHTEMGVRAYIAILDSGTDGTYVVDRLRGLSPMFAGKRIEKDIAAAIARHAAKQVAGEGSAAGSAANPSAEPRDKTANSSGIRINPETMSRDGRASHPSLEAQDGRAFQRNAQTRREAQTNPSAEPRDGRASQREAQTKPAEQGAVDRSRKGTGRKARAIGVSGMDLSDYITGEEMAEITPETHLQAGDVIVRAGRPFDSFMVVEPEAAVAGLKGMMTVAWFLRHSQTVSAEMHVQRSAYDNGCMYRKPDAAEREAILRAYRTAHKELQTEAERMASEIRSHGKYPVSIERRQALENERALNLRDIRRSEEIVAGFSRQFRADAAKPEEQSATEEGQVANKALIDEMVACLARGDLKGLLDLSDDFFTVDRAKYEAQKKGVLGTVTLDLELLIMRLYDKQRVAERLGRKAAAELFANDALLADMTRDYVAARSITELRRSVEPWLSEMRRDYIEKTDNTTPGRFRELAANIGEVFAERLSDMPKDTIVVLPWRAALSLAKPLRRNFERFAHLGVYRDERTLDPHEYYSDLAEIERTPDAKVIIADPMLATGGSILYTIKKLLENGVREENITVLSVISAPRGLVSILRKHPSVRIVTGAIDERLDKRGYIVPGLGDFGDRYFAGITDVELDEFAKMGILSAYDYAALRRRMEYIKAGPEGKAIYEIELALRYARLKAVMEPAEALLLLIQNGAAGFGSLPIIRRALEAMVEAMDANERALSHNRMSFPFYRLNRLEVMKKEADGLTVDGSRLTEKEPVSAEELIRTANEALTTDGAADELGRLIVRADHAALVAVSEALKPKISMERQTELRAGGVNKMDELRRLTVVRMMLEEELGLSQAREFRKGAGGSKPAEQSAGEGKLTEKAKAGEMSAADWAKMFEELSAGDDSHFSGRTFDVNVYSIKSIVKALEEGAAPLTRQRDLWILMARGIFSAKAYVASNDFDRKKLSQRVSPECVYATARALALILKRSPELIKFAETRFNEMIVDEEVGGNSGKGAYIVEAGRAVMISSVILNAKLDSLISRLQSAASPSAEARKPQEQSATDSSAGIEAPVTVEKLMEYARAVAAADDTLTGLEAALPRGDFDDAEMQEKMEARHDEYLSARGLFVEMVGKADMETVKALKVRLGDEVSGRTREDLLSIAEERVNHLMDEALEVIQGRLSAEAQAYKRRVLLAVYGGTVLTIAASAYMLHSLGMFTGAEAAGIAVLLSSVAVIAAAFNYMYLVLIDAARKDFGDDHREARAGNPSPEARDDRASHPSLEAQDGRAFQRNAQTRREAEVKPGEQSASIMAAGKKMTEHMGLVKGAAKETFGAESGRDFVTWDQSSSMTTIRKSAILRRNALSFSHYYDIYDAKQRSMTVDFGAGRTVIVMDDDFAGTDGRSFRAVYYGMYPVRQFAVDREGRIVAMADPEFVKFFKAQMRSAGNRGLAVAEVIKFVPADNEKASRGLSVLGMAEGKPGEQSAGEPETPEMNRRALVISLVQKAVKGDAIRVRKLAQLLSIEPVSTWHAEALDVLREFSSAERQGLAARLDEAFSGTAPDLQRGCANGIAIIREAASYSDTEVYDSTAAIFAKARGAAADPAGAKKPDGKPAEQSAGEPAGKGAATRIDLGAARQHIGIARVAAQSRLNYVSGKAVAGMPVNTELLARLREDLRLGYFGADRAEEAKTVIAAAEKLLAEASAGEKGGAAKPVEQSAGERAYPKAWHDMVAWDEGSGPAQAGATHPAGAAPAGKEMSLDDAARRIKDIGLTSDNVTSIAWELIRGDAEPSKYPEVESIMRVYMGAEGALTREDISSMGTFLHVISVLVRNMEAEGPEKIAEQSAGEAATTVKDLVDLEMSLIKSGRAEILANPKAELAGFDAMLGRADEDTVSEAMKTPIPNLEPWNPKKENDYKIAKLLQARMALRIRLLRQAEAEKPEEQSAGWPAKSSGLRGRPEALAGDRPGLSSGKPGRPEALPREDKLTEESQDEGDVAARLASGVAVYRPLIEVIAEYFAPVARREGPGRTEPTETEMASFYPVYGQIEATTVEIYLPQTLKNGIAQAVEDEIDALNKRIRERTGRKDNAIALIPYTSMNIEEVLARKSENVRKIFVNDMTMTALFRELASPEKASLAKGNRLITLSVPRGKDKLEATARQAWLVKVAILSALVNESNVADKVGAALKEELAGRLDAVRISIGEFVERLVGTDKESEGDVVGRINYFLGAIVRLSDFVGEQIRILKAFWTAA